jgi:hypothetical protein
MNTHECKKLNCITDEKICGDTFLRVEKIHDNEFVVSDIWMYNSNCVYACSTFSQRYEWLKKWLPLVLPKTEGFPKFLHKSESTHKIRGYEEHLEEIGKPGYFVEKDDSEILKISKLSTEISSHLEVLHYSSIILNEKKFEKNKELFKTKEFENIRLNIKKNTLEFSIIERITEYIQKSKPELLVMFTNREKGFFESLFLPSKSAELTYSTKIPVLIFSK